MFRAPITDSLELRLFEEHHAPTLVALIRANYEHLAPWMSWASPEYGEADALGFIRQSRDQWVRGNGFTAGIWHHEQLVGSFGTHDISHATRSTSLGYWVASSAQGQGLITACGEVVLAWCFEELGLHRVWLDAAEGNIRSRKVAERLGMVQEGVLRDALLVQGRWLSMVRYSVLEEEWRERRSRPV